MSTIILDFQVDWTSLRNQSPFHVLCDEWLCNNLFNCLIGYLINYFNDCHYLWITCWLSFDYSLVIHCYWLVCWLFSGLFCLICYGLLFLYYCLTSVLSTNHLLIFRIYLFMLLNIADDYLLIIWWSQHSFCQNAKTMKTSCLVNFKQDWI